MVLEIGNPALTPSGELVNSLRRAATPILLLMQFKMAITTISLTRMANRRGFNRKRSLE